MTGPLYHLGRLCSRHHKLVIAAWIVVASGSRSRGAPPAIARATT